MKIQVLVRSPEWLHSAGARIRYRRLQPEFARLGCTLAIDPLSRIIEGLKLNADVYIFSKCNDAAALMLADMLREAGALVGFDLFDDYISNSSSLTFGQRDFHRSLVGKVDFLLCSTPRMAAAALAVDPSIPAHVLNDPFESINYERIAQLLQAKAHKARQTGRIDILWFGQGANPIFPVGISDLAGFSDALRPLATAGLDVRVKVLTNSAALDMEGLTALRRLPYPTDVHEWSIAAEATSLDQATLAFLPVNYQSFSTAKSLNRAITALTHGTQLLAAGYPLYSALDSLIYSDAAEFVADFQSGSFRMRASSLPALCEHFASVADPAQEAARFLSFLEALPAELVRVDINERQPRAVLHGASSSPAVHTLARSLGWLSLGSPLTQRPLPFSAQIGFFEEESTPQLRLMKSAVPRLDGSWYNQVTAIPEADEGDFSHTAPLPDTPSGAFLGSLSPRMIESRAGRMIHYTRVMEATQDVYRALFGNLVIMQSEMESPLAGMQMMSASQE